MANGISNMGNQPLFMLTKGDMTDLGGRTLEVIADLAADGQTSIHGVLFLPNDFDVNKKYPILDTIYGWPQSTV